MVRALRVLFIFLFAGIAVLHAQQRQPVETAGLRPSQELHWQRVSPTAQQPDGPVLYQLVFRFVAHDGTLTGNGSPGLPLAIANGGVTTAQLAAGAVTFSKLAFGNATTGQALVADGAGGASWQTVGSGTVTSVSAAYPLLISSNPLTTPLIVLNGIVGISNGGTGITSTGAAGNYLRSNGSSWTSSAIQAGDVPSLSGSYVDLISDQMIGGAKTFSTTITATGTANGSPGGQFNGGSSNALIGGPGIVAKGGNTQGGPFAGDGGDFTGGDNQIGGITGDGGHFTGGKASLGVFDGNGIVATAGGGGGGGVAAIFNHLAGGKIISGQNRGVETFSLDGSGNIVLSGRISLGIYVISYFPNAVPYDAFCVDPNDIAISGGAWIASPMSIRESRPTGETPTGQKGPAPNAWKVTCTNGVGDVKCAQAYVVCLSHASQ